MAEMPDGNTDALNKWEREELFRDEAYERRAAEAFHIYKGILRAIDSCVLRESLDELTREEWIDLCTMLSDGDGADPAQAGWLMRRTLERYLFDKALAEVD